MESDSNRLDVPWVLINEDELIAVVSAITNLTYLEYRDQIELTDVALWKDNETGTLVAMKEHRTLLDIDIIYINGDLL